MKADIGLIGLAVMGENLVLNMHSKGFSVAVFNRTKDKIDRFLAGRGANKNIKGCQSIEQLCMSLERPRKVMILIKAGRAVDDTIDMLVPFLEQGDVIIDGGNSHYPDTIRRCSYVESKGLLYVGAGVSGGEEGALLGPSIMPGGSSAAWPLVKPMFQKIAAQTNKGEACCEWVGEDGAGHFVKMVHNGIEYGDMQMICETYHIMRDGLGLSNEAMHEVFKEWNKGVLDSYLIEITADILGFKDDNGEVVIDHILDAAGQKGTGKWTAVTALDFGQPVTLIGEAVFARCLSALKDERIDSAKQLNGPAVAFEGDKTAFIDDLQQALYASKIVSYAQGYQLLRASALEHGWQLNYGQIAQMWRGGCIIRSVFLDDIKVAFDHNPELVNLMLDTFFKQAIETAQAAWRRVIMQSVKLGIPMPAMASALAYYDGYRTEHLPANLLQAQRDYFGAHTYERIDQARGEFFHTNWTGRGGTTSASTYLV